jgi:uncharacterized Tic20 family protein
MVSELFHLHENALWLIGTLSLFAFVATLVAIPLVVIHIPADYFTREKQNSVDSPGKHSLFHLVGLILRNLIGIVFIAAGIAMLVLPGQGIITILIGLMLLNFPGKLALEQRIIKHQSVLRAMNWMRFKAQKPALELPKEGLLRGKNKAD